MKKIFGNGFIALAFVFGMLAVTSTTADAQWRRNNRNNGGYNNQQIQQGYQNGVNTGASDAQKRQSYDPQRSRFYRNASSQAFRDGFVRGYDQGYRQYAANNGNGGYRNDGYYGNNGGRNDGYYGNGNGGYNNQQINAGYQQGVNTGASDGQSNKSYDPQRSRYFKNASSQAYRDGFVRGYDEGFRQYSRNNNGRDNRGNTAATILDQIFRRP